MQLSTKTLASLVLVAGSALSAAMAADLPRLNKSTAAVLIVDHQVGLFSLVNDIPPTEFHNNIVAHAALAKEFNLPTVLTTSAQTGPNGPIPKEILDLHPNATIVHRQGEVDAWRSAEFRAAVRATGKKQLIVAGIVTDVCVAFLSLSLAKEGFEVFVNAEASGAMSSVIAEDAKSRMRQAGVQVLSFFAILGDLMVDWRSTPGAPEIFPFMNKYMSGYAYMAKAHLAAVNEGVIMPGQDKVA